MIKHIGDITKINGAEIEPVWCVIGGSPCQDLSAAGKRAGLAGARSGLFMELVRIVKEMRERDRRAGRTGEMVRPRFLVWENVPGAFSSNFKDGFGDFGAVLEEVCRIAEPDFSLPRLQGKQKWTKAGAIDGDGWSVAWRTHDAQYWGVPQRRRRISLVADFGGQCAGEILFEREGVSGDPQPGEQKREETAGDPADCSGKHDRVAIGLDGYNAAVTGALTGTLGVNCGMSTGRNGVVEPILLESNQNHATIQTDGICTALPASMGMGGGYVPMVTDKVAEAYALDCRNAAVNEELSGTLQAKPNGGQSLNYVNPVAYTHQAFGCYKDLDVASSVKMRDYKDATDLVREPCIYDMTHANDVVRDCGGTSPTLQSRMGTGGNQVPLTVQPIIRWIVRRLMLIEIERLQGFPDHWTDIGEWVDSKGKKHKDADSPRYKALGNSIALPFWHWMLQRMARYLPADATLGSLFDGIGGFPLCWERIHGNGTARWASEIEEFPIAVTKLRFQEKEDIFV